MITITQLHAALAPDVANALADDDGDGIADAGVQQQALDAAEDEVASALAAGGYTAPSEWPAMLAGMAIALAVEKLLMRRRELLPGPWKDRAAQVRADLAEIAAGRRVVPGLARAAVFQSTPPDHDAGQRRRRTLRRM